MVMCRLREALRGFTYLGAIFAVCLLIVSASAAEKAVVDARRGSGHGGNDNKIDFWLTILHNNDGESQLINAGAGLEDFGGVARFATLVKKLRKEGDKNFAKKRIVLTLNSGDNFLAGPEFNASQQKGVPYYDSIALNKIGYDAMALGNHEFDFGPDTLEDFILGFKNPPPFVSANLDFSEEPGLDALVDDGIIVKRTVVFREGETFGIVGATTPELPFISSPRDVVVLENVASLVQKEIDRLTKFKINKIIFISHLQDVNEDLALASQLRNVDIMIAGGGDELLAEEGDLLVPGDDPANAFGPYPLTATGADGAEIPVVTTAGDYKYVGRLIVAFNKKGKVIKVDEKSGLVRVAGGSNPDAVTPDPFIQANVVGPVQDYVDGLAANVIATSEVALEGRRDPGIRTQETNEGNLAADALLYQATLLAPDFGMPLPDVALQNGGGIRNNTLIPAGPITELTTFDIFPFTNFVSIVPAIPRDQFKEIMENAVSAAPVADGRFAQIAGFSMVYDPAGTAQVLDADLNVVTPGTKVKEIVLDDGTVIVTGGAVQPGGPIDIATIDFSARGGDMYPFRGAPFTTLGVVYQQALHNYIVDPAAQGGLGGVISAAQYPEGGEGRITTVP
jgi:5'-nucleotidase